MSAPHAPLLLPLVDAAGTFAFALSGGALGVQKRFDVFGVLFLAGIAAVAGGVTRDLLIGDVPPMAIRHWHVLAIAAVGGLVAFFLYPVVRTLNRPVLVLDAVGLALFAVTGTQKALDFGINPLLAAMLGMISGIGGGMLRDLLAGDVPFVLRTDLYAVAALAAGATVALGDAFDVDAAVAMLVGASACLFLRLMAVFRGWRAPVSRWGGDGS
ncbi:MAG: trimeric intracellular cation channel family protein [Enhydrobacter sp.]|nr:MAG: trimeric intracellular cation channel family protein [Enhydrobacter sp.]